MKTNSPSTKTRNLLEQYIADHGLPDRVELPLQDIPCLTEDEQQAVIRELKALARGDEEAGPRLNEVWDKIWDRLDILEIEAALREPGEWIPYKEVRKDLGLD